MDNKGFGVTVVVHASLSPSLLGLSSVLHEKRMLSSLAVSSITGFLLVLRIPPVVTQDPCGVALTGPLRTTAQLADQVYPI